MCERVSLRTVDLSELERYVMMMMMQLQLVRREDYMWKAVGGFKIHVSGHCLGI